MESGFDSNGTFYLINKKEDVPIVFIHGVGLNHSIWDNQIREFENTVLVYDILGHGKTPLNLNTISFDDFTNQLINLLNHLEIDKIHLVGFSIGSLIARDFATRFSDRLSTLTLLCSTCLFVRAPRAPRSLSMTDGPPCWVLLLALSIPPRGK